jgi:hypothetical protein
MRRHPIDPLSAALGILAVALGVLVACTELDELGSDSVAWIIAGVLLVGLGLVPWPRWRRKSTSGDRPAPM